MAKLKGTTIILVEKIEQGRDPFGHPIVREEKIEISNVLIQPTSTDDIVNQMDLTGKKAVYTLAIPKSDTHNWEDKEIEFFGKRWRTFGHTLEGLDHLIPLDWNKKVMVECYG